MKYYIGLHKHTTNLIYSTNEVERLIRPKLFFVFKNDIIKNKPHKHFIALLYIALIWFM
jgi:hypothetical protein